MEVQMANHDPITSLSVKKSNELISAKYKSSLLENQVMAIALTRIEVNSSGPKSTLEARLYPGDLLRLISDPAHIYRDLKKLSNTIVGHSMFIEDGKGNFKSFAIVPNAEYVNGVFIVKFNDELRNHVFALNGNYTNLELAILTDFNSNHAFRLYEVLRKEVYRIPSITPENQNPSVQVEYNISELKFLLGLANMDEPSVKNALEESMKGHEPDWDQLYQNLPRKQKKYTEWRDFQRLIIRNAQKEIEEKSDIRFDFEGVSGAHNKFQKVRFTIYRNVPSRPEVIDERTQMISLQNEKYRQTEIPYDLYPDLYEELVGYNNLTKDDVTLLLQKANFDTTKIREAVDAADRYSERTPISNYMGWLIKCIEEGWQEQPVAYGSAEQGERVQQVIEAYAKTDKEKLAAKMWHDKIKFKEDFPEFESAVEDAGMTIEQLEVIYSYNELVKMYTDYKFGRKFDNLPPHTRDFSRE